MSTASPTIEQATRVVSQAMIDAREAFIATVEAAALQEAERHAQRCQEAYELAQVEVGRWGNPVLRLGSDRIWIYADLAREAVDRRVNLMVDQGIQVYRAADDE